MSSYIILVNYGFTIAIFIMVCWWSFFKSLMQWQIY